MFQVLLLEAGGEEPEEADVPSFSLLQQHSSIDWDFMVQPQSRACLARVQGRCAWARGRVLGGSSTINYMIYFRGAPRDFDEWEEMGNPGWSYRDVLPTFIEMEHNGNIPHVNPHFHGTTGDMSIETFPHQDQNVFHFLEAYRELGLDIFDQNTDRQIGASLIQTFSRNGERFSANAAYIRPIRNTRKNFVLRTNAYVTRILINPETKTACGVEYIQDGQKFTARASKEVILSAGAIMSPKLLMLSGIGPAKHLQQFNIPVLQDLDVGYNLHDHATTDGVVIGLTNLTATTATLEEMISDVHQWKQYRRGPLSSTATIQVNAFVQTKYERQPDRQDIQYVLDPINVGNFYTDPILSQQATVDPRAYYDGVQLRPVLLDPKSRGRILLNNSDPVFGYPLIHPNTFVEDIDIARMVEGIKQGLNLLYTDRLKSIGAQLVTIPLPACLNYQFGSDDYWACVCMSYTATIFHPVGTCKMGPPKDRSAVVDPRLRVYGIRHLRVVDASIIPKIMRANPNAGVLMIAQKATKFIKDDWINTNAKAQSNYKVRNNFFDGFDLR